MLDAGGIELPEEEPEPDEPAAVAAARPAASSRSRSSRGSSPTRSSSPTSTAVQPGSGRARRLAGWELLGPLFRSFEYASNGASCMPLPEPVKIPVPLPPAAS